jgi:dynein heavy chain
VFGLHENANITFQAQESEKIVQTILSIQPRMTNGSGGKSQDDIVMELAIELEGQLPPLLDKANAKKDLFKANEKGLMESLSTVLL